MTNLLFPEFEVLLTSGQRLRKTEYASSNISFNAGYGQALAISLTIVGEHALALEESGQLDEGAVLSEVYGGYRDDEMLLLGKNLLIWDSDFAFDAVNGAKLVITAYGCSQYLRESGQRTERLVSTTYAAAAKEIAARWNLTIGIGAGAYRAFKEGSTAFQSAPDAIQTVTTSGVVVEPLPPASSGVPVAGQPAQYGNTRVASAARQVANGVAIKTLTHDTKTVYEYCAQFARQVVEHGLGLEVNQWEVAKRALKISGSHNRSVRYAVDYELAARQLGLAHNGDPQPGDVLFQGNVSLPAGHVCVYVGEFNGVPVVVENTTANHGVVVIPTGPIRRVPLSVWGAWTTCASPVPVVKRQGDTKPPPLASSSPSTTLGTSGITAKPKPTPPAVSEAANKKRKIIMQENESDFDFLSKIGKEIGYIVAESPLGNALYFGPGLEVGSRERHLLIAGEYAVSGQAVAANVSSYSSKRTLYGIPAEIVVTGFENGKRFSLIVTPEELADRQGTKIQSTVNLPPAALSPASSNPQVTLGTAGITAVPKPVTTAPKTPTKPKVASAGAANYASTKVATLLTGAYPVVRREILGGASSKLDALERGLETLALTQLQFQEVQVSLFGIAEIQRGDEIILQGSFVPKRLRGLYMVRHVGGDIDSSYKMKLTLNRNSEG